MRTKPPAYNSPYLMPLSAGTTLGPCEILAPLGAGMGADRRRLIIARGVLSRDAVLIRNFR